MSLSKPLISVIIPVFNRKKLIINAIFSVLNQTTTSPIEIIVVDDGSIDGTPDVIRQLQKKHTNISMITQENKGVCAARNAGFQNSKGEFIQFLDSDDLLSPKKFEIQIQKLIENPDCGLCSCKTVCFDDNSNKILNRIHDVNIHHDTILPAFLKSCQWQVLSPLYRRSACELIGTWNEHLMCLEDWEYGCRFAIKGLKACYCSDVLAFVREHDSGRLSRKGLRKTAENLQKAIWSIYYSLLANNQPSKWRNILARHMLGAGRAYLRCGDFHKGIICLNDAQKIAQDGYYRNFLKLYVIISKIIGYQHIINIYDKLILIIKNKVKKNEFR